MDALKRLRRNRVASPTLALTGDAQPEARIQALQFGADDCLVQPVIIAELVARVHALARRAARKTGDCLEVEDLMDSAYDSPQNVQFSHQLGHEPLIEHNPRGGEKRESPPAQQRKMPCSPVFSNTPRFQKCLSFAKLEFRGFSRRVLQEPL